MKNSDSGQLMGKALLLIWAILCMLLFISISGRISYVQWSNLSEWQLLGGKLERLDPGRDLANFVRSFVGIIIFSISCTSVGIFVARIIRINSISNSLTSFTGLASLATEFLIGHELFSLVFLTLGGLYQLTPTYVVVVLSVGFLIGFGHIRNRLSKAFTDVKLLRRERLEKKRDKLIAWLSIGIVFLSLLYSTARISYDSSAVYFSDAKLTAMTHRVQIFMEDNFVASSFQSAIQYTALIETFGDQSARMLSWIFGIVIIIFSLALGEKVGISKQASLVLLAVLLTSTALLDLMGDGKVDLISSAPAIAAVYWMVVESQDKTLSRSKLLLVGFFISMAIVARPFNAFLLGFFAILFYIQRSYFRLGFEPLNYKLFMSSMFWVGIGGIGLGIYHLFANWMILGHPLSFLSIIPKINSSTGPWDYDPKQIFAVRLLYPFVATFYNSPQTLGNISPMFVAFLPAFFIHDIRKETNFSKQLHVLSVISIITLLLWIFLFFTVFEIRYVLFLWVILFLPLAEIITTVLENKERFFRNISSALIIALLIFTILRTAYISFDTYSPIDEQGNPQCFCQSLSPINEAASSGDRVLTLNAFRYYLRSDLFACSTKHDEYRKLQTEAKKDNAAFWLEVYRQGYEYISYEHDYTTRHLQMGFIPSPSNTPEWIELESIYSGPDNLHMAYRINIKNPPSDAKAVCERNANGIWEVRSTK